MFSGALIRMGKEVGVECPYNEMTYNLIKALEEKLDAKLYICDEAQLCGALGAALFAYEKCSV